MKSFIMLLIGMLMTVSLSAAYDVGDTVNDMQFKDLSWNTGELISTSHSIQQLVEEDKTVIIYFPEITYA